MRVVSVNRGEVTTVDYKGTEVKTGIFKYPVDGSIFLGEADVEKDSVVDRRFHGGIDKAVYAYSLDHYPFWQNLYPELKWDYGMFGENLTIEGLDEASMLIGSTYQVGKAIIQVCQPRQPCMKLGIRFETQEVLKSFVNEQYSGVYFRVLKPGDVQVDDQLVLISKEEDSPSIADVYKLMYHRTDDSILVKKCLNCKFLPDNCKERVKSVKA